jgi:glycosyltransferase involved in cell wall biosynthesis
MTEDRRGGDDPRPARILVFGSYDQVRHPRVAVLRSGLAAAGHEVTELNRPLGMSTADKVDAARSVAGTTRFVVSVVRSWTALVRARRTMDRPDVVVVGYLGHLDVHLARWLWRRSTIVLDHMVGLADTVRDRNVGRGPVYRLLDAVDRAALRRADVVVVDTEEQLQQLPERAQSKSVVVAVGATDPWFDHLPPPRRLPLKVCFVGLYTPLQGAPVIGAAISELADDDRIEFTMVGAGQELEPTRTAAAGGRVRWIDWVPGDELPALVASHDVGLGIFGTSPKAWRVVPNKVYQSLAAGNVVVTSDTPVQRRVLGDVVRYVPPGDPRALAGALRALADQMATGPDGLAFPSPRDADRFRPCAVVAPLLERLGLAALSGDGPVAAPRSDG